jgi:RNA polymerase sigma-70 factor (ECF subfamily)
LESAEAAQTITGNDKAQRDRAEMDRADVDRVLAGDPSAFEGIVCRWQAPLINLAYRFCRDRARAEEMAQEAFLRAFRALPKWRRDAAFSTWLFALAANVYKTELRRVPVYAPLESAPELADPRAEYRFEEEARIQQDRALHRAVATLPEKYRDAIILYYFQSMDLAAASRSLNLPEGTLKVRLFRGRELLRQKLAGKLAHLFPASHTEGP